MANTYKTLFSKSDLYSLADRIVDLHAKMDLLRKWNESDPNKEEAALTYGFVCIELESLINSFGLREMCKINW